MTATEKQTKSRKSRKYAAADAFLCMVVADDHGDHEWFREHQATLARCGWLAVKVNDTRNSE